MRFQELEAEWDDDNVEHIARHGVEPEEVEEIVYEDKVVWAPKRSKNFDLETPSPAS